MMYKRLLMIIIVFFMATIYGCAKVESQSKAVIGSHSIEDLASDNGRHIEASYDVGDYSFKINTDMMLPKSEIKAGVLAASEPDLSLVEQYLCGGMKLYSKDIQLSEAEEPIKGYASDSNESNSTVGYDIEFYDNNEVPGDAIFYNYRLDQYLSTESAILKSQNLWTDEQQTIVDEKVSDAQLLFLNLKLDAEANGAVVSEGDIYSSSYVIMNMMLGGCPLIDKAYGTYIQSIVQICDQGINSINFSGLLEIYEANSVKIISVDEVLAIIETGVADKNINTYSDTIESLRLSYMINFEEDKITFFPVWCFSSRLNGTDEFAPCLCINAQNGAVEYMR